MSEVILVMVTRQLKRYWRSKARFAGSLIQPLLFLFAFGYGFGPIFEMAGQGDYLQFLAPGIMAMSVLFTAMFNGIEVIFDRQFGFLKETLVAPVSRTSIMLGKTLGGASVAVLQGIIIFIITLIAGFKPHWPTVIIGLAFMVLIALFFTALSILIASKMTDMHAFPIIINFLIMPMFFLSGALFPLDTLPKGVLLVTQLNPLTYGVDGFRGALTGISSMSLGLDAIVMIVLSIIIIVIGAKLFSETEA